MLESLDQTPWGQLEHSEGRAYEVPDLFRQLIHRDDYRSREAVGRLGQLLISQGPAPAAVPAIPFLLEVLAARETNNRALVIALLRRLAGVNQPLDPLSLRFSIAAASEPPTAPATSPAPSPIETKCRQAVLQGVPLLIQLLSDADRSVRVAAALTLAFLPEAAEKSLTAFRQQIRIDNSDAVACMLLAARRLLPANDAQGMQLFEPFLTHSSLTIRAAAAFCVANGGDREDVFRILEEAATTPGLGDNLGLARDFRTCAIEAIGTNAAAFRHALGPLSKELSSDDPTRACNVAETLLLLVFPARIPCPLPSTGVNLYPGQSAVLIQMAYSKVWLANGRPSVRFIEIMKSFGLPTTRQRLARYLAIEHDTLPKLQLAPEPELPPFHWSEQWRWVLLRIVIGVLFGVAAGVAVYFGINPQSGWGTGLMFGSIAVLISVAPFFYTTSVENILGDSLWLFGYMMVAKQSRTLGSHYYETRTERDDCGPRFSLHLPDDNLRSRRRLSGALIGGAIALAPALLLGLWLWLSPPPADSTWPNPAAFLAILVTSVLFLGAALGFAIGDLSVPGLHRWTNPSAILLASLVGFGLALNFNSNPSPMVRNPNPPWVMHAILIPLGATIGLFLGLGAEQHAQPPRPVDPEL